MPYKKRGAITCTDTEKAQLIKISKSRAEEKRRVQGWQLKFWEGIYTSRREGLEHSFDILSVCWIERMANVCGSFGQ